MSMNVGTNYSNYTANYSKVDNKSQNKVKTETEIKQKQKRKNRNRRFQKWRDNIGNLQIYCIPCP